MRQRGGALSHRHGLSISDKSAPPQAEESYRGPVVLVGIVTRDRARILPKAIRSAQLQSYPQLRVAVLDDGSVDETPGLQPDFPELEWCRWEQHQGILESRNQLMRTAKADYYLSLDDDAWFLERDEIAVAVEYMETHPRVAVVAFDILSPDRPLALLRTPAHPVSTFIGCGHLLRLSAAREVGFYASSPGFYGSEEKDLCLRLLDRGWDIHRMPGVHVWHDKTIVSRDEPRQHRSGVCNDLVFAIRRCPLPLLLGVFPIKVWNHLWFSANNRLLGACASGFGLFGRYAWEVWHRREPVRTKTYREYMRRCKQTS